MFISKVVHVNKNTNMRLEAKLTTPIKFTLQ